MVYGPNFMVPRESQQTDQGPLHNDLVSKRLSVLGTPDELQGQQGYRIMLDPWICTGALCHGPAEALTYVYCWGHNIYESHVRVNSYFPILS